MQMHGVGEAGLYLNGTSSTTRVRHLMHLIMLHDWILNMQMHGVGKAWLYPNRTCSRTRIRHLKRL